MTPRRTEASFFVAGLLIFGASVAATVYWHESMPSHGMPMPGSWSLSPMWMRMPGQTWLSAAGGFVAVWTVMMLAMMLPSLLPTLSKYRRSVRESQPGVGHLTIAAGGYFLVWILFGVVAYAMANLLLWAELSWPALAELAPLAAGIVVLLAGLVQLTPWKARQLGHCRDGFRDWSSSSGDSWRFGLHLGTHCALCCSALMTLLLVTGVMNLGLMAIVATAITIERLAPAPQPAIRLIGVLVMGAGILAMARGVRVV